jgi:hypothetical protein
MKRVTKKSSARAPRPEMLPEYDLRRARRGTHAHLARARLVAIDPDVWALFPSAEAVNNALRAAARSAGGAAR